jgi:hypothetical protein
MSISKHIIELYDGNIYKYMEEGFIMSYLLKPLQQGKLTLKNRLIMPPMATAKCGIINLTSDIGLFYETTFKETNLRKQLPKGWFEKLENFKAPQLKSADATIDVSLINLEEINNEKTRAICRVNRINVTTNYPMVYNRALALTLEAIIHSTRIQAFLQENRQKEAADLLALVMHCKDVVNRVGPN